jgi:hypothetical protein
MNGEDENIYKTLLDKSEVKGPIWRCRRRCEINIKMYLEKIGCKDVRWIH